MKEMHKEYYSDDEGSARTPTPESEIEAFLRGQELIECARLAARIPRRQCVVNRHKKLPICTGCKGKPVDAALPEIPATLPWRASHNAVPRQIRTHEELVAEFVESRGGGDSVEVLVPKIDRRAQARRRADLYRQCMRICREVLR
jgi:hypothetical protein